MLYFTLYSHQNTFVPCPSRRLSPFRVVVFVKKYTGGYYGFMNKTAAANFAQGFIATSRGSVYAANDVDYCSSVGKFYTPVTNFEPAVSPDPKDRLNHQGKPMSPDAAAPSLFPPGDVNTAWSTGMLDATLRLPTEDATDATKACHEVRRSASAVCTGLSSQVCVGGTGEEKVERKKRDSREIKNIKYI